MEAALLTAAACGVAQCEAEIAKLMTENIIRELRIKLLVMEHKLDFATHLEPQEHIVNTPAMETPIIPIAQTAEEPVEVKEAPPKRNKKRQPETIPQEVSPQRKPPTPRAAPPPPPQSSTKKRKLLASSKPRFSTSSASSTATALRREMFSFTTRMQAPKLKSSTKQ